MFQPCISCRRHIKSAPCPFCGTSALSSIKTVVAAVLVGAAVAACRQHASIYGAPPGVPQGDDPGVAMPEDAGVPPAPEPEQPEQPEDAAPPVVKIQRTTAPIYGGPPPNPH